jgi:hypothetical protein
MQRSEQHAQVSFGARQLLRKHIMAEDSFKVLEREAVRLHAIAPWLTITPARDPAGQVSVDVALVGSFKADPKDLAGSVIREIHRRLDEFESMLDE